MNPHKNPFTYGAVPVPNVLFDVTLRTLSDTQLRVLLVVMRSTIGWREGDGAGGWQFKQRDWLSHAQLVMRTGRKSEAVSQAVSELVTRGMIVVESNTGALLDTPELRRRHIGRLYYRLGDMWITRSLVHPGKPKTTTTYKLNYKGYTKG